MGDDARDAADVARRLNAHLVAGAHAAGHDRPGQTAKVGRASVDPLYGQPQRLLAQPLLGELDAVQEPHQGRPVVPGHRARRLDDVVPVDGGDRDTRHRRKPQLLRERAIVALDLPERGFGVADEVHLVHGQDHVTDTEQRHQVAVAASLREQSLLRVDEDDAQIGGRGAGDHVARVLFVARCVGDDEVSARRREETVRNVDGDALLALRGEPIEQKRVVQVTGACPDTLRVRLERRELVVEQRLRLVEQAPDQGALAVVHATARVEAQERLAAVPFEQGLEPARVFAGGHRQAPVESPRHIRSSPPASSSPSRRWRRGRSSDLDAPTSGPRIAPE